MRTFRGGVHIPDNKALSDCIAIEQMPIVADYYVSLSQHIGKPAEPVVQKGDEVVEGQLVAKASSFVSANIHSPICGEVVGVEKRKKRAGRRGRLSAHSFQRQAGGKTHACVEGSHA